MPLMWWDDSRLDINQTTFGMPSYVGIHSYGGANHEAINTMGAVLSGFLSGYDLRNHSGPGFENVDFVAMLDNYFDTTHNTSVWKNRVTDNGNGEFWYQAWINMLPLLISWTSSPVFNASSVSSLDKNIIHSLASWLAAIKALDGNFNYTGFDFIEHKGVLNGKFTQPEAAGGLGFLFYNARARYGDDLNNSLLHAAIQAIEFLEQCEYNVFWEILVPFGAVTAARMNAELGTSFDVTRLVTWVLQDTMPDYLPFRAGWGVFAAAWGGVDVSGIVGSVTDGGGYAFAMDTFVAQATMLPVARYDPRFAQALGKWAQNAINAARLFYPSQLPTSMQSDEGWASGQDIWCIPYEGLRCVSPGGTAGPFGTGDAKGAGDSETNFAMYGGAYVGLMAALVRATSVPGVWEIDLLATDWCHAPDTDPAVLVYNPHPRVVQVSLVARARAGISRIDVVDRVSGKVVARGVVPGEPVVVAIDSHTACLIEYQPYS
jgi:hypothetical protein